MKLLLTKLLLLLYLSSYLPAQETPKGAPLTESEWALCESFILKKAKDFFIKGILTISPQQGLPYPIEKDPTTGSIYIHLKGHPQGLLGSGAHKLASKSILYSTHAQVIARCEANKTAEKETEILRKLTACPGLVQWYSTIKRSPERYDLFFEYCNGGTLQQAVNEKLELSDKDLLSILLDLSTGLQHLHEKGYLHRDLHCENILLSKTNDTYHGRIIDMGWALPIKDNLNGYLSITDLTTPPEIYIMPLDAIDRISSEIYSLGVLFYILLFQKNPSWTTFIEKWILTKLSLSEKIKRLQDIRASYEDSRMRDILSLSGTRRKTALLIFQMINPDPEKRPALTYIQTQLSK